MSISREELPPGSVELKIQKVCESGFLYGYEIPSKQNGYMKSLHRLELRLTLYIQENKLSTTGHLEEKDYVAAYMADWNRRYCRGLITNVPQDTRGGTYKVFLIDYGTYTNLNIKDLRKLPTNFGVTQLHEQSYKIALYGVLPIHMTLEFEGPIKTAGKSWHGKDAQFIRDKLKHNNEVYFKEVGKLASFKFGYIYLKVDGKQNDYVTLQQLLINENHAVKYDNFEKAMPSIVRRFLRSSENISFHGSDEDSESTSITDTHSDNESVISLDTNMSDDYMTPSSSTESRNHESPSASVRIVKRQIPSEASPPKRGISRGQLLKNLQSLCAKKVTFDESPSIIRSQEALQENQFNDAVPGTSNIKATPSKITPPVINSTPISSSCQDTETTRKSPCTSSVKRLASATPSPQVSVSSPNATSLVTPPSTSNCSDTSSPVTLSSASSCSNTSTPQCSGSTRGRGRGRGIISLIKSPNSSDQGSRKNSSDSFSELHARSPNASSSLSRDIIELTSSLSATSISTNKLPKTKDNVEIIDLTQSTDSDVPLVSARNNSSPRIPTVDPEIIREDAFKRMGAEQIAADKVLIDKIMIVRRKGGCDFEPVFKMHEQDLHVELRERLGQLRIQDTTRCQQYMIPAMLTRKHVTLVDAPKQGKTLACVISLISLLKEEGFYKSLPSGPGPKAIILSPYSSRCEWIYTQCADLTKRSYDSTAITNHLRINVAYGCGKELERDKLDELTRGYDIVICTPPCLLRLLEIPEMFNLKRLCHLVLDEAHLLLDCYYEETFEILKRAYAVGKKTENGLILPQRVIISDTWLPKITQMIRDDVVKKKGVALVSSYLEAAVFCNLKASLKFFYDQATKMADILEYLNNNAARKNVVVVFSETEVPALDEMYYTLRQSCYRRVIKITHAHFMMGDAVSSWIEEARSNTSPILLCTDNTVHDIAIYEANCLIHYNVPQMRGFFSSRFMFLLRCLNIPPEYRDEETPEKDDKPETVIYLGTNDYEQFPTIINLIERLHATVPKEVQEIACKLKVMREQKKGDVAFCQNLKKFGRCIDVTSCEYRHNFSLQKDEPDTDIPLSGLVKVHILRVHSATHFSVRLLEHKVSSENWSKVTSMSHPHVMNARLKRYLDNPDNRSLHQCEAVGEIAAIETAPQMYKRAKILKLVKNEDETKIKRVIVRFMEDGSVEEVRSTVLLKLPEEFTKKPACAVDVFLCDLLPVDRDIEWGERINATVREKINAKQEDISNFFVGRIQLVVGRDIWLKPLECKQWFTSINQFVTVYNISRDLLREKMAVINEEHLTTLLKKYKWAGFDMPEEIVINDSSIILSPQSNKMSDSTAQDKEQEDSMNEITPCEKEIDETKVNLTSQNTVNRDDVDANSPPINEETKDESQDEDDTWDPRDEASVSESELSSASANSEKVLTLDQCSDLTMQVAEDTTFDVNFTEDELKAMIKNIWPGILPESDSENEEVAPPMIIIKPNIDWRQDLAHVFVTIYVNTDDYVLRFNTDSLYFRAKYDDKVYEFNEKLYASINEITSSHHKSGVNIAVKMEKLVTRNKWSRLFKIKEPQHWVKVNKEFLLDEDEDYDVPEEYWTEKLCLPPAYVNEGNSVNKKPFVKSNIGILPDGYEESCNSDEDSDAYVDRGDEYYHDD